MPIWWRRARFSSSRATRERKIEDRERAVLRKSASGENYEKRIIPVRSETSWFSRGTIPEKHGYYRIQDKNACSAHESVTSKNCFYAAAVLALPFWGNSCLRDTPRVRLTLTMYPETSAPCKLVRSRGCKLYWKSSITISGFDPSRSGGPHVPAPLEVKICMFPILLKPYTNWR